MGDGSGDYIQCDNENCPLRWFHWQCVHVTEAPAGTWYCPDCSPSATFYIKQLVTKRPASPVVPNFEMADEAANSKTRKQKSVLEIKEQHVAKKGIAVRKDGEKKPKPKWKGWVELSSDGEQEFKQKVDAQWEVNDDIMGKRRRGSRAMVQETELSPRALRARSRPEQQIIKRALDEHEDEGEEEGEDKEAESDVSIYHKKEDTSVDTSAESEESEQSLYKKKSNVRRRASRVYISSDDSEDFEDAPVRRRARRRAPIINSSSDESNDSEDTMDVYQEPTSIETNSSDELSDLSPRSGEEKRSTPGQASLASEGNHEETPRQSEAVDTEDSIDLVNEDSMEYQHEEPKASHSDLEEDMYDDVDDDAQESQASITATPVVDNASLQYQCQVNCRGGFPESAIRSTLPRLG